MNARTSIDVKTAMFWRKRMILHRTSPRIQVSVTSHTTVGGMQTKTRMRSHRVKLARKRLVVWLEAECFLFRRLARIIPFPVSQSLDFFGSRVFGG